MGDRPASLDATIARWMNDLRFPPDWRLASRETEQGIALGFAGPAGRLTVELDALDPARGCYARTARLNVYYSAVDRTRRDLDGPERAVIGRVIARLETVAERRARRGAGTGAAEGAADDGMEALRRMAGGRGTFTRVDDPGSRDEDEADDGRSAVRRASSVGLVAERCGFNLHAVVRVEAEARDALERLCRSMARPAVATERVSVLPDGNLAYRVKSPRRAGATHRVMSPMEFMARLAAAERRLAMRTPLVRYHGVLAPNSPWRVAVVPLPPIEEAIGTCSGGTTVAVEAAVGTVAPTGPAKRGYIEWARLLWRVWKVDALKCPACEGRRTILAVLTERTSIVRVRAHLGVSTELPRMRRARDGPSGDRTDGDGWTLRA